MKLHFDSSNNLKEALYLDYGTNSLELIRHLRQDKTLTDFDAFNKRFKISWGMQLEFTDNLNITRPVTRDCYKLMLKISDLWFSFEHLANVACEIFPKKKKSAFDLYDDEKLQQLGFPSITAHFNQLLKEQVLHKDSWRNEVYVCLGILAKNTHKETKDAIKELIDVIRNDQYLNEKHIFALAYALRNLYVHKGISAALGGKKYEVKKALYSALYDCLILYSLALGNCYCQRKLSNIAKIAEPQVTLAPV